jgi:SpoVK/Ycf46/Vps4 family AAA+-type ATPase
MSGHNHHHVANRNLISAAELQTQFDDAGELIGERYQRLLREMAQIAEHQWRSGHARGLIKGFFLSGPPGTGKTTLAKRLTHELALRFEGAVVLAFVDGGEIARSRYGESEERIIDLFMHAKAGFTSTGQRSVLLFDDVESIFMARGSTHAKEWHFSQDSVFFHAVDELDTSRAIVVLTSNRPDLVDEAIRDRFLAYEVGYPAPEIMVEVARNIAAQQQFDPAQLAALEANLRAEIAAERVRSLRDVQRFVVRAYVGNIVGGQTLRSR